MTAPEQSRTQFEAWARARNMKMEVFSQDSDDPDPPTYTNLYTNTAWLAWSARDTQKESVTGRKDETPSDEARELHEELIATSSQETTLEIIDRHFAILRADLTARDERIKELEAELSRYTSPLVQPFTDVPMDRQICALNVQLIDAINDRDENHRVAWVMAKEREDARNQLATLTREQSEARAECDTLRQLNAEYLEFIDSERDSDRRNALPYLDVTRAMSDKIQELLDTNANLRTQLADARKDGERLDHILDVIYEKGTNGLQKVYSWGIGNPLTRHTIDAARSRHGQGDHP